MQSALAKAGFRWDVGGLQVAAPRPAGFRRVSLTIAAVSKAQEQPDNTEGDDEDEVTVQECLVIPRAPAVPGKPMRVERLLANLGYGKRRDCQTLVKRGRVLGKGGARLKVGDKVLHSDVTLDGEPLDPPFPLAILLHKPIDYVVTSPEDQNVPDMKVYDLLPYRFAQRRPFLSAVGRLDKDTSGLLIMTDDGQLVHRINHPKSAIWKVYEAKLAQPMTAKQVAAAARKFASGTLLLQGDVVPLLPAKLTQVDETTVQVAICEGRYHQVRRMIASLGNEVVELRRLRIGGLELEGLPDGEWRYATADDLAKVFGGPSTDQVMGGGSQALQAASSASGSQPKPGSPKASLSSDADTAGGTSMGSTPEVVQPPLPAAQQPASRSSDGADEQHDEGEVAMQSRGGQEQEDTTQQVSGLSSRARDNIRWRRRRQQLQQSLGRTSAR